MNTRERKGAATKSGSQGCEDRGFQGREVRLAPLVRAMALTLAAGGLAGTAHAQRAFSPAWFANKGAAQNTAAQTGLLPNGLAASSLTGPLGQSLKANETLQRSINNLNLAARGIAAQQAAQTAARASASEMHSDIADGLADNGLRVDTSSLTAGWINANGPAQTMADGKTTVTIEQTDQKAILNWERFNVGKNTTVHFDQRQGTSAKDGSNDWIALNRVNDPNGRPSQVAGQIKAEGAVYIVNRNGVVFNGTSQVNTRSLVASSLALSDQQFKLGINNPLKFDAQGNDFAIPQFGDFTSIKPDVYGASGFKPGDGTTPDMMGSVARFVPGPTPGAVVVDAGARLDVNGGGKVMLFAPKVRNAGRISAPDGQVIMAAGENIYLMTSPPGTPGAVRGLDVAASAVPGWAFTGGQMLGAQGLDSVYADANFVAGVRSVVLPELAARAAAIGYEVVNSGTVQADRGNITLQARDVQQNGVLLSTTALNNRNGSILLRAWGQGTHMYSDSVNDLLNWTAGTLTLGQGSLTQILPDATDTSEIESTALATRYQAGWVGMYGQLIDVQSRAGVLVPSGNITMESAVNPIFTAQAWRKGSLRDASRIYLDSDAFLSVAGLQGMQVAMARNFVEAELRINELRDSHLQQDAWVRGKKVIVDRRAGGVFTDGPMAGVQWVQKKDANGQMTYMPGEWVGTPLADVAGWVGVGKTDLAELSADAGNINLRAGGTFIARAGSLLDVSGGSVRYLDGMNTATHLMGADGRMYTMDKAMPDMAYTGVAGEYARTHARWGVKESFRSPLVGGARLEAGYTEGRAAGTVQIYAGDALVLEGELWGGTVVGDRQQGKPGGNPGGRIELGENTPDGRPWSPGNIIVSHDPKRLAANFGAATALGDEFYRQLQPDETASRKLTWLSDDMLSNSGMGTIVLNVINGDFELQQGANLDLSPGAALFVVGTEGSTSSITVSGRIRTAGGTIVLDSINGLLKLGQHGQLDASGQWLNHWNGPATPGAWAMDGGALKLSVGEIDAHADAVLDVSGGGRVDIGKGGMPSLRVGDAGAITLSGVTPAMDLAALNLRAWAAGSAGSLVIQTRAPLQIGGATEDPATVLLPPTLYGERGFGSIVVSVRNGGIVVPQDVTVSQQATSIDLNGFAFRDVSTGVRLADVAPIRVLAPAERLKRAPSSVELGTTDGGIDVAQGASIVTGVGGLIRLRPGGPGSDLTVRGRLEAPAGRIELGGDTLLVGSEAQILARGVAVIEPDARGRLQGQVLAGGAVLIDGGSAVDLEAGALVDVSGATGRIELPTGHRLMGAASHEAMDLASDGGAITVKGGARSAMRIAANLQGHAGGPGARGGSLTITDVSSGPQAPLAVTLPTSLFWRDPVTGNVLTGRYNQIVDMDLYDEYGAAQVKFTAQVRSALLGLVSQVGGGMEVVTSMDGASTPSTIKPWEANPAIDPVVVDLLTRYFYSDRALTRRIAVPDVLSMPTSRVLAGSLSGGGFGSVSLDAGKGISLGAGVNVNLKGTLNLSTIRISNGGTGSAELAADHISLTQMAPYVRAGWSDTAPADSQLTLKARLLDIQRGDEAGDTGTRITGYDTTVIEAGEVRLGGALPAQINANPRLQVNLDVDGDLLLKAGQVYPTTAMTAVLRAGDTLTVERLGTEGAAPLSAGGVLRLESPVILQNGVLRAPLGKIELLATDQLTLGAGSLTSVSGAGVVVPYGTLSNNEHWRDPTQPVDPANPATGSLKAPPEKRITMKAPDVNLAAGAVVDIAGGGDLYAWEFVPGPGGSHDVLAMPGVFAVMPGQQGPAPVAGAGAGERVWLAGGAGFGAGWYTLLPARYALLPGAFAVQPMGQSWAGGIAPVVTTADGSLIMQGKGGNAYDGSQDAQASAWRVMPGATLRKYTEYNEAFANEFFSSEAFKLTQYRLTGQNIVTPRLARDGGAVVFDAGQKLTLNASLKSMAESGGRGGLVDIAGQKIAIVGAGQDADGLRANGYLVIDSQALTGFGAGSLLVGGTRRGDPLGLRLDVTASDIVVRNDASSALRGAEILLAASNEVRVDGGSVVASEGGHVDAGGGDLIMTRQRAAVIDTKGTAATDDDVLVTPAADWGALVRVANGAAVKVVRSDVDTTRGGLVSIGAGAVVQGGDALLIDATRTSELASSAVISGTDLSVAAGRIGFGGGTEGMVLDNAALAQLAASERLTLRSYSSFDFYGALDLRDAGIASLTFDGAHFIGQGGNVSVKGDTLALLNSSSAVPAGNLVSGGGSFVLDAQTLVLGGGQKTFAGFGTVNLGGRGQIVGEGAGGIDAGNAELILQTPLVTGRKGAAQTIATQGALRVTAGADGAAAPAGDAGALQDSLGSRLSLRGASIGFNGRAVALGGTIDMTAAAGAVTVGEGAVIDVGGFAKQFFDVSEYADAGRINLVAVGGDVRLGAGSQLNLAAHRDGGNAGTLSLAASSGGTVVLGGAISAQASGKAGSFMLDIETLPDFAAFSQRLNDAGFNRSRQFRIRQGDVVLGGLTTVEDFGLTADRGRIDITGTIDARAAYGGAIRITAGSGLTMQSDAQLLGGATGELGSGRVTLEAAGGTLALHGGRIDLGGNEGGKLRLRARQNAAHSDLDVSAMGVAVAGARSAVLEGVAVYDVAAYDGVSVDSVKADALLHAGQFAAAANAVRTRLGTSMAVMPGIEIRSTGDLAMRSDWNLFTGFAGQREGTLTLRAGGNLRIDGHLSDGFDAADRSGTLQEGASWNLRLVAGGDLQSAHALALKPLAAQGAGSGSIVIGTANTAVPVDGQPTPDNGAGKLVRTGTGDLDVSAGSDLVLAHKESVVYTAGRKDTQTWSDFSTANPMASYGIDGGNLDINAQASIEAQHSGQRIVQWLNRQGALNDQFYFGVWQNGESGWSPDGVFGPIQHAPAQSSWWINYGAFQQGVGALGGGNVKVNAGGDLGNLLVALPTTMRMRGGRSETEARAIEVRNGGAMTVEAGGVIRGGQYYIARGTGDIRAGETTVGHYVNVDWDNASGSLTRERFAVAPVLALGDATLSLRTAGNLLLQTVVDPMLVRYGDGVRPTDSQQNDLGAYMSGYTDRTALQLVSTGGDIVLSNRATYIFGDLQLRTTNPGDPYIGSGGNRYPARVSVAALNGSLALNGALYVMPGTVNDVRMVAQQDVRFNAALSMPYATPLMVASPFMPAGSAAYGQMNMEALLDNMIGNACCSYIKDGYLRSVHNPDVLPLATDFEPSRIYAARGSILGLNLKANEQTWVRAGTDIRGVRVAARNVRASDVTLLEAGNDILATTTVRPFGENLLGNALTGYIEVQGPGTLVLAAGRDVYADNLAVQTVGNQRYDANNRAMPETQVNGLPSNGAAITVMAGMNAAVGYDAFARAYLDPAHIAAMPDYLKVKTEAGAVLPIYLVDGVETRAGGMEKTTRRGLVSFVRDMTGETLAPEEAWTRFQALPLLAQQQFLRQVYLLELREAGRDQNEPGSGGLPRNGGYNRGYEAIKTLFPGDSWKGDVAASSMMLRTMAGGDINVLTPGGGLQVAALGSTVAAGYGLVTLASGHINIFANDDVIVNQSRILSFVPEATRQGSDQIVWSTVGDIDAGRGSKTVRVPSAPEIVTDVDGNTIVLEKSDMSGSGIGTVGDGDVDLVAPLGTVNAGDAGLRVAGNLNIAALHVLNADNIQVKGEIKGLPAVAAVNIGALTNASAAAAQASAAAQETVQRERTATRQALPSIFTVRVLGFGNEPLDGGGDDAASKRSRQQSSRGLPYDPANPVQFVGVGQDFDARQLARLSTEQRRQLQRDR